MRLKDLFKQRSINVQAFAREHDLKPTTLYNILSGSTDIDNVGIFTFKKIAHGLGMSSDELAELLEVGKPRVEYYVMGSGSDD